MTESLDALNRTIADLDARMTASSERMARSQAVGALLADLVGSAETEDGNIRVEWSGGGLSDLVLNPRAMRLTSEDLAAAIKQTLLDAVADFQTRVSDVLRDNDLLPSQAEAEADLATARENLTTAQRDFTASMRSASEALGQAAQARRPQR